MDAHSTITLQGVRVHNLKSVDLQLPRQRLIVFCGLSGSGKSSLAVDTLYAEGQRRYIETFSAYTRQYLEQLEKPEADRIDGIPPAIAVTTRQVGHSSRATVGAATEVLDHLRLLYAHVSTPYCGRCGAEVRRDTAESIVKTLESLAEATRYQICFPVQWNDDNTVEGQEPPDERLREAGFNRLIVGDRTMRLGEDPLASEALRTASDQQRLLVLLDRLVAGRTAPERLRDSVEAALRHGRGRLVVLVEIAEGEDTRTAPRTMPVDGRVYRALSFSNRLACDACDIEYPAPEPRLFSFNSPLGACKECEGFGNVVYFDMDRMVPNRSKTIRDGAIVPWTTPAYKQELRRLLNQSDRLGIPVDVPFHELTEEQVDRLRDGVPEQDYGGLAEFFDALERRKYKMHIRVFLSRWRSYKPCPACHGRRLRAEALAFRLGGRNLAEVTAMSVHEVAAYLRNLVFEPWQAKAAGMVLEQVRARLEYLQLVGLDYLTLDRPLGTLSGGEQRRVSLTSALGSGLVNMLYVLDEPSVGLHPRDILRLLTALKKLRDRANTVVVVEHEEAIVRDADFLVEVGPEAGERGGQIVYAGPPQGIVAEPRSLTGDYLAGRRGVGAVPKRRPADHGAIRLDGARGNNLKNLSVDFPLGVLCVVTGVSGSGKSSLVTKTLHPAICRRLGRDADKPLEHDAVLGVGQIDDVILVDQSPIGRSPRSNPVTYIKAFDEIRNVFADTVEAKTRNYSASHFSFNVEGGRCSECEGEGFIAIDMQFLADVYMKCPRCGGRRYQRETLEVTYRGRNIAEVLDMTVREAFHFFRGKAKVQQRLKRLIDVGLDYIRLGQPANTLSGGESQRLKLAGYMANMKKGRCLFLLDEPTTGLHFVDIVQLLDCFDALIEVGHSLIVVEHNLQLIKAADYVIDLGPDAADRGGQIVARGTPEQIAATPPSITGRYLRESLGLNASPRDATPPD